MIKKDKQNKEIIQLQKKVVELESGWKRTQADFDNYRKRSEQEKNEFAKFANENLILDILPVLDNFSLALAHKPENLVNDNYVLGLEYIKNQLEKTLLENNLNKVNIKIGDDFDPQIAEAIEVEETKNFKSNQITEIIADGYMLNNKLIRPAKVKVAK